MKDDSILRALGRLAREQDAEVPPAELLSASPEKARARIAQQALAALEAHAPAVAPQPAPVATRRARPRFFFPLFAALAGVAAALLVAPRFSRHSAEALPSYALEASGGVAEVRGAEPVGAPLTLEPDARIELRLRPQRPVTGPVAARLFWRSHERVRPFAARAEISSEGGLRLVARAERPFGAGEGEIIAVVGRPTDLPSDQAAAADLDAGHAGWQVLHWPVRWR